MFMREFEFKNTFKPAVTGHGVNSNNLLTLQKCNLLPENVSPFDGLFPLPAL